MCLAVASRCILRVLGDFFGGFNVHVSFEKISLPILLMCINCQVLIRDLVLKLLPVQENIEIRRETRKSNYVNGNSMLVS